MLSPMSLAGIIIQLFKLKTGINDNERITRSPLWKIRINNRARCTHIGRPVAKKNEAETDLRKHFLLVEELDHDVTADNLPMPQHHHERRVALLHAVVDRRPVMLHVLVTQHEIGT